MSKLSPDVVLEKYEGYAIIRWNRPSRKNAILHEMEDTVAQYLTALATDDSVTIVILTGTGDYYTSGFDISSKASSSASKKGHEGMHSFKNFVDCLIKFPKPIIAAVNGPAIGMGVSTLPLCDVVYASSDSTFLTPFSRIAMVPEACSSYTFPIVMGYAKANEMLLFNRTITATEAYSCGLVTEIFPKENLMKEVLKRVEEFLDNPKMCLIYGKQLIRGRDREKLLKINAEECERLVEREQSEDTVIQGMKFVQRRMDLKKRKQSKL